jgi:hypothetical protein
VLVFVAVKTAPGLFQENVEQAATQPTSLVEQGQQRAAQVLEVASFTGVVIFTVMAIILKQLPGWGFAISVLGYLLARMMFEIRWQQPLQIAVERGKIWLVYGLALLAVIAFLKGTAEVQSMPIFITMLLVLAIANLLRFRRQIGTAGWLVLGSLIVFTLGINAWQYSGIGDEYSFYFYANNIIGQQSLASIGQSLFKGQAVYGSHPYISSLIQAVTIKLLGSGHFGWDFSNPFLCAIAVGLFYSFFKRYISSRAALFAAIFIGVSYYIINFSKIGYNNLQSLFAMALVLYVAGYAIQSGRGFGYTLLGAVMGFCLYVYPAALYILPLPVLMLLIYVFPRDRTSIGHWVLVMASFFLFFLPLLFQPQYFQSKLPGTMFNTTWDNNELGLLGHLTSNALYILFSFVFVSHESHFIVTSYVDPLTALFIIPGIALTARRMRHKHFALFSILGYACFLLLIGVSHDRDYPPNTRAFLLLPWFALFAGLALDWIFTRAEETILNPVQSNRLLVGLMVLVLGLNLYQAFPVTREITAGIPSMETLFLRLLQADASVQGGGARTYLFITDSLWGIDGFRLWTDLYNLPPSKAQIVQSVSDDGLFTSEAVDRIRNQETIVIVQPWMDQGKLAYLEAQIASLGKSSCVVRDTRKTDPRFTFWYSEKWKGLCDLATDWQ